MSVGVWSDRICGLQVCPKTSVALLLLLLLLALRDGKLRWYHGSGARGRRACCLHGSSDGSAAGTGFTLGRMDRRVGVCTGGSGGLCVVHMQQSTGRRREPAICVMMSAGLSLAHQGGTTFSG